MVTRSDGKPASLEDVINPTPAITLPNQHHKQINYDAFDGVYNPNEVLESGTLSWREMKVQGLSSCGR